MASIFSRIIQGELPCEKIHETDNEICLLDISPFTEGHTLVIPKREVARFEELPETEALSLMHTMQRVSKAVCKAYGGADYNIQLNNGPGAGQEVPHVHFHIIPRIKSGTSRPLWNMSKNPSDPDFEALASLSKKLQSY